MEPEVKCVSTIYHYNGNDIINNIIVDDFTMVIWDKLEKLYLVKSLTNKLYI